MAVRVLHKGRVFIHFGSEDFQSVDLDGGFVEKDRKWTYAPEKVQQFKQKYLPSEEDLERLLKAISKGQPYQLKLGNQTYRISLIRHEKDHLDRFYWQVNDETYVAIARRTEGDVSVFIAKENSVRIPVGLHLALSHASIKLCRQKEVNRRPQRGL